MTTTNWEREPQAVSMSKSTLRVCLLLLALACTSAKAQDEGIFSPPPTGGLAAQGTNVLASEPSPRPDWQQDETKPKIDLPENRDFEAGGRTIRRRTAKIDLARLAQLRGDTPGAHFNLNLFRDASFMATDLRTAPTFSGYSISGQLEGVPFGTVTLVVHGDIVVGSLRTPKQTFTIRSIESGKVEIREVDPSTLPPLAEPLVPKPSALRRPPTTPIRVESAGADDDVIDVLVAYTRAARENAGGHADIQAVIDLWVAETNQAYADSGVEQSIHLVHAEEVGYVEQDSLSIDLDALACGADEYSACTVDAFDELHEMRERLGVDLVSLVTESGTDFCGMAFQFAGEPPDASPWNSFSAVGLNCGARSFAHELGHNMGLLHDRYLDADFRPKMYPYAHGYVNQEAFKAGATDRQAWNTIMAYYTQCYDSQIDCRPLMRFSNPDQSHEGDVMGIPGDEETLALDGPVDARRALNGTRSAIATTRPTAPALYLDVSVVNPDLDRGQAFTLSAEVRNRGRVGSDVAKLRFHVSTDPYIESEDVELDVTNLPKIAGTRSRTQSLTLTAPEETGNYYYGVCIDGDQAVHRCSAAVPVAVGPNVSLTNATVQEGDDLVFSVRLSEPIPDTTLTVHWLASRGTAAEPVDFKGGPGTLTIPAGETEAKIIVPTIADDVAEPDDTVTLSLLTVTPGGAQGGVVSRAKGIAVGTIQNDDGGLSIPDENLRMALADALGKDAGETITEEDLVELSELDWSQERREALVSRGLMAQWWHNEITDLTGLEFATDLRRINLTDNNVSDLSPVAHLPRLQHFNLGGEISVSDVTPLAGLTDLRTLQVDNGNVQDISALAGLVDLRYLSLGRNAISDISALAGMTKLRVLHLTGNPVSDLSSLSDLQHLSMLWIDEALVSDISPLANLKLDYLNLAWNVVSDVSPLKDSDLALVGGCGEGLILSYNNIVDLSALVDFVKPEAINLEGNKISNIRPLSALNQLRSLNVADNAIRDIGPLAKLTNLSSLILSRNSISDVSPLASLILLKYLYLNDNAISDIGPLASLKNLVTLDLSGNRIDDISSLSSLDFLVTLRLGGNAVVDIDSLGGLAGLRVLDISNNRVENIRPLTSLPSLIRAYILGNPLSTQSVQVHLPSLKSSDVAVFDIALTVADGSAKEGDLEGFGFPVYLSSSVKEAVTDTVWTYYRESNWHSFTNWVPTASMVDLDDTHGGFGVTIPAGSVDAMGIGGRAIYDGVDEKHETFVVKLQDSSLVRLPDGVAFPEPSRWSGNQRGIRYRSSTALGLVVDPAGPSHDLPLFFPAGDDRRESFARVVNRSGRDAAHVEALDDTGTDHGAVTLTLRPGRTLHFTSEDLAEGNRDDGVHGGVGVGDGGNWRLKLWANDIDVLAYVRSTDGFVSSVHDTVPLAVDGTHHVPIFNPGSNQDQVSLLRLANPGAEPVAVKIAGVDDGGASSGAQVSVTLDTGESRTISAEELELGTDLDGALGDGDGKWRLTVSSDRPIVVASLLEGPTGHLTNLSTVPSNTRPGKGRETIHDVPLFPSAGNRDGREGLLRIINRGSEEATLRVKAYDDTERDYEAVTLKVAAGAAVNISSDDLEFGNPGKGLSASIGAGERDWRLELSSDAKVDVLTYVRTQDGFLTAVHDTVRRTRGRHEVPTFYPGSNNEQVSLLRVVNPYADDAQVSVRGIDDLGIPRGIVEFSLPAGTARMFTAQQLEAGGDDFSGALGDGTGKWRLIVESRQPVQVLSLLENPTGHLTNLSTFADPVPRLPPDVEPIFWSDSLDEPR